jgi:2-polyprenyl-3-methyl-5-hydroxy-6-metoxy-1,4-benzoquinol methylase
MRRRRSERQDEDYCPRAAQLVLVAMKLTLFRHILATYMHKALQRSGCFLRTGYWHTRERCCAEFPDDNFVNHLKVYKFASQFCVGKDVLDVGCGTGYGTSFLAASAKSVIGIDISRHALRYARRHYSDSNIQFRRIDAEHMELADQSFDVVISTENFEHLSNQRVNLSEMSRVLRDDGMLLLATPNHEMFIDIDNPYHTHELSYEELREMVREYYREYLIAENLLPPPTLEGHRLREARRAKGAQGIDITANPMLWERHVDATWACNTHSFFCFARLPVRISESEQAAPNCVRSKPSVDNL